MAPSPVEDAGDAGDHEDPITSEEITDAAAQSAAPSQTPTPASEERNAFTELMSSSKGPKPPSSPETARPTTINMVKKLFDPRDGLGAYILHPDKSDEVVEYDDDFVVIRDKYPKATVHLLLIPRDPHISRQHPLQALSTNPVFLAEAQKRVKKLKKLVASELRRTYGQHSASDAPYQSALEDLMSSSTPPSPSSRDALLPPGRDWTKEVVAGVHTHPSMNHLHIHILSREMHSPWLKHKKHYLSFNTSFFVRPDEFPLEEESGRFQPGDWPNWDMVCWRCGKNFQNKFAKLKEHLEGEWEEWKKE